MSEESVVEYKTSLEDLTFNSKPVINMLTMVAEENIDHAEDIVRVIEQRMIKAPSNQKLPLLYLVDSILKNVKGSTYYKDLIKVCIVNMFSCVFEKVDEKTRQSMYKLRQTWGEIFGNKTLYALDKRVCQIDPAWPVTAKSPDGPMSIHVNPKFLNKKQSPSPDLEEVRRKQKEEVALREVMARRAQEEAARKEETEMNEREAAATRMRLLADQQQEEIKRKREQEEMEALMREQLLSKQQELIKLQQERLELELLEARSRLEQQTRQLQDRENQMRQQLLQQLKQNESVTQQDAKAETKVTQSNVVGGNATNAKVSESKITESKLKGNDVMVKGEVKPVVSSSRDPRLSRDPRISTRDPRSVPSSVQDSDENKNETPSKSEDLVDEVKTDKVNIGQSEIEVRQEPAQTSNTDVIDMDIDEEEDDPTNVIRNLEKTKDIKKKKVPTATLR